jgi:hypothetical protein
MNRERIKHQGTEPLNGNDAYAVLGIVFDWIEEAESDRVSPLLEPAVGDSAELLDRLRKSGYCGCTTEFGCVACGGS